MTVKQVQPVPLFINGEPVQSDSTFEVINPLDGTVAWQSSNASVADAEKAIEAAQAAFPLWSRTKSGVRRDIFLKAAELFSARRDELFEHMKTETAADDGFIWFNIETTISQLKDTAGRISSIQGSFPSIEGEGRSALVLQEPYGVILGIAPWNAPYILGCRAISAALAAGNTTILKGSEASPRSFQAIADIFSAAGLPKGCLNFLVVDPKNAAEVTNALIAHPAVGKINFTGSTPVGRIIAAQAGKYLKPVLLELGGKASSIVCEDAELNKAAMGCTIGAFLHSGQVCMATDRIIVHSSIAQKFAEVLKETVMGFAKGGPPILISTTSAQRVKKLVDDAIKEGATPLLEPASKKHDSAFVLEPVVLENVTTNMELYYKEAFGPVVALHTFNTDEEALAIANDTDYGLAGAVFTKDLARGIRLAKNYVTGAVHINSMTIHDEAALPHGGFKSSGFGRFNSAQGISEFLRTKVITWED